jgi:DNA polymerase III epsilon subunit-like protein
MIEEFIMNFVVFDSEFNQNISALTDNDKRAVYPFEIIQIGAVKLDESLNVVGTFNHLVKPTIYSSILPFITKLTGIETDHLMDKRTFPSVFREFVDFAGVDSVLCMWGMSDIKELFRNSSYHGLNLTLLPKRYINLQGYASMYFNSQNKNQLRLQHVVELMNIPVSSDFHDALNDAYYTAEIFKKLYNSAVEIKDYDPDYVRPRISQPRKKIDTEGLLMQFEKMYQRQLTLEEKSMIILSYKMGKTGQFLK